MNIIRKIRKEHHLSQLDFAKLFNVHQTAVSQWENDRTKPDIDTAKKMSEHFGVSLDYILGNTAQGFSGAPQSTGGKWIPVLGRIAAGLPIEVVEEVIDYEEIDHEMANTGEFFGLSIVGDSMEPRIQEGDVVIVRRQSDCESGQLAVVIVNGEDATLKRIKKGPDGIMLIPSNPKYEPVFYSNEQVRTLPITIVGRVVELRGKF